MENPPPTSPTPLIPAGTDRTREGRGGEAGGGNRKTKRGIKEDKRSGENIRERRKNEKARRRIKGGKHGIGQEEDEEVTKKEKKGGKIKNKKKYEK